MKKIIEFEKAEQIAKERFSRIFPGYEIINIKIDKSPGYFYFTVKKRQGQLIELFNRIFKKEPILSEIKMNIVEEELYPEYSPYRCWLTYLKKEAKQYGHNKNT